MAVSRHAEEGENFLCELSKGRQRGGGVFFYNSTIDNFIAGYIKFFMVGFIIFEFNMIV